MHMDQLAPGWQMSSSEIGYELLQPMTLAICLKCDESTWGSLKMSLVLAMTDDQNQLIPKIKSLEDPVKTEKQGGL